MSQSTSSGQVGLPPRANLRPAEIAEFLSVSTATIYRMIEEGEIPALKVGGQIRVPRERFLKWYDSQLSGASGPVSV